MRLSRRQFVGLIGAAGLSGCARLGLDKVADKVKSVDIMPGSPGKVTFAAIGDIHVLDARSTSIVNKAMATINANADVRFTVMCGDLATDGNWSELKLAKSSLDRLDRPYFSIPGNHDVCMKTKDIYANYRKLFDEADWRNAELRTGAQHLAEPARRAAFGSPFDYAAQSTNGSRVNTPPMFALFVAFCLLTTFMYLNDHPTMVFWLSSAPRSLMMPMATGLASQTVLPINSSGRRPAAPSA